MKRVAIIGGGLSGLSAAYELTRNAKVEFTLFERSERLGGIVETVRQDGFVIECGPDAWVTEKPWARELAAELGLEAEILPSNDAQRRTYLLQRGELIAMPDGMRMMVPAHLDAVMKSPLFSEEAKRAYEREPERAEELKASTLKENEDESVASFVRRHFGDEVVRTIAGPLLSGVFGGDVETLSVRAVMPAFVKMEREHGSLIKALQAQAGEKENAVFTTLRLGLGTLIDRIVASLPEKSVRVGDAVIAVTHRNPGWRVRTADAEEMFDAVIVATPAHLTPRLLQGVDEEFADLLAMEATSAIVVALAFSPEQAREIRIPRGFGFLVPEQSNEDPQLLACTFVDQKFSHRVPEGGVLLRAFFGGAVAAGLLNEDDEMLTTLALRRLSEALGSFPTPHIVVVRRWPWSLPQYAVGHLERMARLEKLVARFPGLHLVGNAYYGVGLPDMVCMGRGLAVQATASRGHSRWSCGE
jgi:protoporphyrinogen/coproporphyrinogen III oxidase